MPLSEEARASKAEKYRATVAAKKAAREQGEADIAEVLPATTPADVSTRNSTTTGWSKQDIESVGLLFSGLLLYGSARISRAATHTRDYAMQDEEAESMAAPLARIMCRHAKIKVARKGDLTDIIAVGAAALAYGMRVSDVADAKRHGERLDGNLQVIV